jgi:hypothetical protein
MIAFCAKIGGDGRRVSIIIPLLKSTLSGDTYSSTSAETSFSVSKSCATKEDAQRLRKRMAMAVLFVPTEFTPQ